MTKASGAKTLPEVAKNSGDESSEVSDLLQSSDWQEMLENARRQRSKNIAAREEKSVEKSAREPGIQKEHQSTTGRRVSAPKKWQDRVEEARKQREAVLARRAKEAESSSSDTADSPENDKRRKRMTDPGAVLAGFQKPKVKAAETDQKSDATPKVDPNPAVVEKDKDHRGVAAKSGVLVLDEKSSVTDPKQVSDASPRKLRRKLLRSWGRQQEVSGVRYGSLALGCAVGAIATATAYFAVTEWDALDRLEELDLGGMLAGLTQSVSSPSGEAVQPLQPDSDIPPVAENGALFAPGPSDIAQEPTRPEPGPVATGDANGFASLKPPASNSSESTGIFKTGLQRSAPNVAPVTLTLDPPSAPVDRLILEPWPEADATPVAYRIVPTSPNATDLAADAPLQFAFGDLLEATRIPAAPPSISLQPAALRDHEGWEQQSLEEAPKVPDSEEVLILRGVPGSAQKALPPVVDQPERPFAIDTITNVLRTASSDPAVQIQDLALGSDVAEPRFLRPEPRVQVPQDSVDLPEASVEPPVTVARGDGAEFRLFAPRGVSEGVVDSIVSTLGATGHRAADIDRVGFGISQSNVRFYHRQDAEKARALAEASGAVLRDFTGSGIAAPLGVIELWLAGESSGRAAAASPSRSSNRSVPANTQVEQLRSQVLNKLKTANQ